MERTGVARIFLEDARWYVGKRVENFTTNNFRLYFFEKNKIILRSLRKIYKFQGAKETHTTIFSVCFGCTERLPPKTDKTCTLSTRNFQSL